MMQSITQTLWHTTGRPGPWQSEGLYHWDTHTQAWVKLDPPQVAEYTAHPDNRRGLFLNLRQAYTRPS